MTRNKFFCILKYLFAFSLVALLLFLPDLINYVKGFLNHTFFESTFIIKYDWNLQHIPFYQEFYRLIESGEEISWSWNQFLGIDFYASKAYYLLGDFYAWIGYIFYRYLSLSVSNCLFAITLIKVFVSGCFMHLYLQLFCSEKRISFLFSVLFMTSGWVTIFIEQPVFLSFYSLCPLLLWAAEKALQTRNTVFVMISSALLLMMNYYLTWMFCLFLFIYWIVRYWQVHGKLFTKKFWLISWRMLFSFLIGVFISAVVWFPSLKHMLLSSRLSSGDHVTFWIWENYDFMSIVKNFFVPVFKFDSTVYRSIWYYFYQIGIYCGSIHVLLVPQFYSSDKIDKKTKIGFAILLSVFLLTLISPQFGKLFHFTYSLRYTMIFVFILLLIGIQTFEKIEKANKKVLIVSSLFSLMIFIAIGILFPILIHKADSIEVLFNVFIIVFLLIYTFLLSIIERKNVKMILALFVFVEALIMGVIPIQSQKEEVGEVNYLTAYESYLEAYQKIKEIDSVFSRVYIDGMVFNEGMYLNIPTTSTYDSCYQYTLHDFLQYMREYPDVDWAFSVSGEKIFPLLDVKYIISEKGMGDVYYQYFCELVELNLNSNLSVYRVNQPTSFIKSYQSFTPKSKVDEMANHEENYYLHEMVSLLSSSMVVEDDKIDCFQQKYGNSDLIMMDPISFDNDHLEFLYSSDTDTLIMLSMAYDPGWTLWSEDQTFELFSVQGGFAAAELPAGEYKLYMDYSVPGRQTGKYLSLIGCVCGLIYFLVVKSKKRGKYVL